MANRNVSLNRTLTLTPIVLFGLAYTAPMIVFGTFGVLEKTTHGVVASSYVLASIAMLFTAYSYGRMVKAFPVAGSAYTYIRKAISSHLGFMIGWAILLDYLFLPMVIWLIGKVYLAAAFPSIPAWIWVFAFIIVTTVINLLGIKISTNVNFIMVSLEILVVLLFIALCIKDVMEGKGTGTLVSAQPFFNKHTQLSYIASGASIAAYSFLGFDAVSTFSEEALKPKKIIPKAILLVPLIAGGLFVAASYFTQLAYPHYHKILNFNSAGLEIAHQIGGNLFKAIFLGGLILAQFASGITAQSSVSRLLYSMGRDSVLPKKIFGYLHPKFRTPVLNFIIVGFVGLLALWFNVSTSTSFINFGAFTAFTFVNVAVILHFFIRRRRRSGSDILLYLILPLIGAGFDIWLWFNLDTNALILGGIWSAVGFVYLLFLTNFFRKRPPEINYDNTEVAATEK